jgi:hypothetical protein
MCKRAALPRDGRLASADVGAANARLGSARLGEVLLEILLAEPHRAGDGRRGLLRVPIKRPGESVIDTTTVSETKDGS